MLTRRAAIQTILQVAGIVGITTSTQAFIGSELASIRPYRSERLQVECSGKETEEPLWYSPWGEDGRYRGKDGECYQLKIIPHSAGLHIHLDELEDITVHLGSEQIILTRVMLWDALRP